MSQPVTVKIEGMEDIARKFKKMDGLNYLVHSMRAAANHVKSRTEKYPPSTAANSPGQKHWYERGYGPKWTRKDGSIGSKKTSKMLNRSWTMKESASGLTQTVGTAVSYAPYVHEESQQAPYHKDHGWKTIQTTAKEETPRILRFLADRLEEWINSKA